MTTEQMTPTSLTTSLPNLASPGQTRSKKDELKLINYVLDGFTKAKKDRWKNEKQWYLNLAFYFGRQNILVHDAPGAGKQFKLYTPPAPYYRSRPVINRIRPLLRTEMSKLTSQRPTAYVVPSTSDDRDMYAANAAEQIWDSLYNRNHFARLMRRAVFWTSVTGNGFIKSWWDEDKVDEESNLLGDICFESLTPFHVFVPDLKEEELENQPWVIHAANKNTEQLSMHFGMDIKSANNKGDLLEESFSNVMGIDQGKGKDETIVYEMWLKPGVTKLAPDGAMITVCGDSQLLAITDGWPYEHNQFPFAHIGHVETGKFYRDSTVTDLVPLQREYNRTRGQIIEAKNRMSKPQLVAEMGSLDASKITSEPGQVILYRPGFAPPQPLALQGLPSYVLQELDRIQVDMNEISGQHEVSRGQVPSGITAATAISYLQEQDDSKLAFTYDSIEEATEKLAFQTLTYVKQFWDTPRMVKVAGDDSSFDVLAFQGSDLRGNTDIRIESGSALPTSRAAKQAFIMDLMKMGFIDPQKGLEVMEIGGINKIYESIQVDARQAQRENLKMAQVTQPLIDQHNQETFQKLMQDPNAQAMIQSGQVTVDPQTGQISAMTEGGPVPFDMPLIVPVNDWDNHQLHIAKHNDYRKSQSFENLPDEAKQVFDQHVRAHVHAIVVGAQGAMQLPPEAAQAADNPDAYNQMQAGVSSASAQPVSGTEQPQSSGAAPSDNSQNSPT